MKLAEAKALIAPAVHASETWADLGAGTGTFTRALASLVGVQGRVYAVDRDRASVNALRALAATRGSGAEIIVMQGDFSADVALPLVDGVLLANALHFVDAARQADVLARLEGYLRPEGRLLIVEYENRTASQWVPHPVSFARLGVLAASAGLATPVRIGEMPSEYGGTMYASVARPASHD
jgi:precorrin-6B methylase 2